MSLIDDHLKIVEVDQRLAEVQAEEDLFRKGALEATRQYLAALDAHHAKVDEDLAAGKAPTSVKPQPSITPDEQTARLLAFERRREALHEERRRTVVVIGPEVEAAAQQIRDQVLMEARPHLDALESLSQQMQMAQRAVTEVAADRSYFDRMDPQKGGAQIKPPDAASPESLIQALRFGSDPLHVGVPRRLGFSDSNLQALPETAWEPPVPA